MKQEGMGYPKKQGRMFQLNLGQSVSTICKRLFLTNSNFRTDLSKKKRWTVALKSINLQLTDWAPSWMENWAQESESWEPVLSRQKMIFTCLLPKSGSNSRTNWVRSNSFRWTSRWATGNLFQERSMTFQLPWTNKLKLWRTSWLQGMTSCSYSKRRLTASGKK